MSMAQLPQEARLRGLRQIDEGIRLLQEMEAPRGYYEHHQRKLTQRG